MNGEPCLSSLFAERREVAHHILELKSRCLSKSLMQRKTFLRLLALSSTHLFGQSRTPRKQSLEGKIENAGRLANFIQALQSVHRGARREPVRILHFGDSHVAADILSAELRNRLQHSFGDGGPGFILPRNPFSTPRRNVQSGASGGWILQGIGISGAGDGIHGLAGISLNTVRAGQSLWVEAPCKHVELFYLKQPDGGSIDIMLDGSSVLEKPLTLLSRNLVPSYFSFDAAVDERHRIEVRTVAGGEMRVFGVVAEHETPGVVYDVLGINGARASRMIAWNQAVLSDNVSRRKPDLIILAYGTNEVTDPDWTSAAYTQLYVDIIRRMKRAAPHAAILVWGPPDRAIHTQAGWRPVPPLGQLIEAQWKAAVLAGAAFWDSRTAMGGEGSIIHWAKCGLAQADHVHLTGAGYLTLADKFYEELDRQVTGVGF
jgi:lysophospholipase L1-like esterase